MKFLAGQQYMCRDETESSNDEDRRERIAGDFPNRDSSAAPLAARSVQSLPDLLRDLRVWHPWRHALRELQQLV